MVKLMFLVVVLLLFVSFLLHFHFLSVLLCLEGLTLLAIFSVSWMTFSMASHLVFLFLVLGVTEAALGMSILVSLSRSSFSSQALLG